MALISSHGLAMSTTENSPSAAETLCLSVTRMIPQGDFWCFPGPFFKFFMALYATKSACSEGRSFFAREDVSYQGPSGNTLVEILYGDGVGAWRGRPMQGYVQHASGN